MCSCPLLLPGDNRQAGAGCGFLSSLQGALPCHTENVPMADTAEGVELKITKR